MQEISERISFKSHPSFVKNEKNVLENIILDAVLFLKKGDVLFLSSGSRVEAVPLAFPGHS